MTYKLAKQLKEISTENTEIVDGQIKVCEKVTVGSILVGILGLPLLIIYNIIDKIFNITLRKNHDTL